MYKGIKHKSELREAKIRLFQLKKQQKDILKSFDRMHEKFEDDFFWTETRIHMKLAHISMTKRISEISLCLNKSENNNSQPADRQCRRSAKTKGVYYGLHR